MCKTCARQGHITPLKALLERRCPVGAEESFQAACQAGQLSCVELLRSRVPRKTISEGMQAACLSNAVDVVALLLPHAALEVSLPPCPDLLISPACSCRTRWTAASAV